MKSKSPTRKLAAIMFTDIAGYTALSAKDEEKALELIDKQRELLEPIVTKFNGEWLKEMGDGLLLSFPSSKHAVNCAIKIQQTVKEIEDLNLRIGIHQGDRSAPRYTSTRLMFMIPMESGLVILRQAHDAVLCKRGK